MEYLIAKGFARCMSWWKGTGPRLLPLRKSWSRNTGAETLDAPISPPAEAALSTTRTTPPYTYVLATALASSSGTGLWPSEQRRSGMWPRNSQKRPAGLQDRMDRGSVGAPSKAEAYGLAWVAFGPALAPGKASGPASAPSKAESSGFEGAAGATHAAEDSVHGKGDSVQEATSTATGSGCAWLHNKSESSKAKAADHEPPPRKYRKVPPSFKIASMFGGYKER